MYFLELKNAHAMCICCLETLFYCVKFQMEVYFLFNLISSLIIVVGEYFDPYSGGIIN